MGLAGLAQWVGRPAPVYERGLTWLYQVFYTYVDDWTLATESHRRTIAVGLRGVMADLRERGALVPDLPPEIAAAVYDGEADG